MKAKEFIKKWNIAFEDKEQELEFKKEMRLDLEHYHEKQSQKTVSDKEIEVAAHRSGVPFEEETTFEMGAKWMRDTLSTPPRLEVSDFTNKLMFWNRLKSFVLDVTVGDPMSSEEKQMILHVCDNKISPTPNEDAEEGFTYCETCGNRTIKLSIKNPVKPCENCILLSSM